jgi:hypothetical protein
MPIMPLSAAVRRIAEFGDADFHSRRGLRPIADEAAASGSHRGLSGRRRAFAGGSRGSNRMLE